MAPEAAEAIRIADKHLAGRPPEDRAALAKDIIKAVCDHSLRLVEEMFGKDRRQ